MAAILAATAAAGALPEATYLLVRGPPLPPLARFYDFPAGRREMLRMIVEAATFRPLAGSGPAPRRLGLADLPDLLDLYESAFNAD